MPCRVDRPGFGAEADARNWLAFRRTGVAFDEQPMDLVYGVLDFHIEMALSKVAPCRLVRCEARAAQFRGL